MDHDISARTPSAPESRPPHARLATTILLATAILMVGACSSDDDPQQMQDDNLATDVSPDDMAADSAMDSDISGPDDATHAGTLAISVAGPCNEVMIPAAMRWGWESRNHRVRRIGFMPIRTDATCTFSDINHAFIGGDFTTGEVDSDDALVDTRWNLLTDDNIAATVARVDLVIPAGGTLESSIIVPLPQGFPASGTTLAFVSGFIYDTDVAQAPDYPADTYPAASGFTSRGIGVGVMVSELQTSPDTHVDVQLYTRFEHGRAGDNFFRPDHNAAFPFAQSGATVEITVLRLLDERPVLSTGVDYIQESDEVLRFTDELDPPAAEELRRVELADWSNDAATTAIGITYFDLRLYPSRDCTRNDDCTPDDVCDNDACAEQFGPPGDYIREMSIDTQKNFESSPPALDLHGYAASASTAVAILPMRNEFSGRVTLISTEGHRSLTSASAAPAGDVAAELSELQDAP